MSCLLFVCFALAPSLTTSSHRNYLRQTKAETRSGRPEGFTWTNLESAIASTTSSTFVQSSTEPASASSTVGIGTSSPGYTTSTSYWQLSTTSTNSDIGSNTDIASLPTTSSTGLSTFFLNSVSSSDIVSAPSAEFEATPVSVAYMWNGGTCNSDFDCYLKIRERVPGNSEIVGAGLCECYASSIDDPLDECQSSTVCPIAGCLENACSGQATYCSAEKGVCVLKSLGETELAPAIDDVEMATTSPTGGMAMSVPDMQGWCVDDSECRDNESCLDESNGMCFFPPCGRCTDSSDVIDETIFISSELSMSVPDFSLNQDGEFEWIEPAEASLSCKDHDDCVETDGCCMSDGICHPKTKIMPICWWMA